MKKTIGVCVVFVVLIACSLGINEVNSLDKVFTDINALERTYYLVQIVAAVALVSGAMIAWNQYVTVKKQEYQKYQNERIQKAVNLSEYYKNHVLIRGECIYYMYRELGLNSIYHVVKNAKLKEFDEEELYRIVAKEQVKNFAEKRESKLFMDVVMIYAQTVCQLEMPDFSSVDSQVVGMTEEHIKQRIIKIFFHNKFISEVLNNLEYFAMNFTHNTADDSVVFQSLQASYLRLVEILYVDICRANAVANSKLYTNTIELYMKWRDLNEQRCIDGSEKRSVFKGSESEMEKG